MKKATTMWEYKVGINVNIANLTLGFEAKKCYLIFPYCFLPHFARHIISLIYYFFIAQIQKFSSLALLGIWYVLVKTPIIHQLRYWRFEIERVWRQFTISPASHQQLTLCYQQSNNSTQTNAIPLRVDLTQYQSLSAVADLRMGARYTCSPPPPSKFF